MLKRICRIIPDRSNKQLLNYVGLLLLNEFLSCLVHISNTFIGHGTLTSDLMSSVIGALSPSILKASLPLHQHFLSNCIHQDRSLHPSTPLLSCLSQSLIPSLTTKWKGNPGVSEAGWQQSQRWKDEKREGAEMKAKRRDEKRRERKEKSQSALTVNGVREEKSLCWRDG